MINKEMRALARSIVGKEITKEERALIGTVNNEAILPREFVKEMIEIKKGYGSLKELCHVIPVDKSKGSVPVVDYSQNENFIKEVLEGQEFTEADLATTDINYECKKIGLFFSVSTELEEDAEVKIEDITKNNFSELLVIKENKKILDIINKNAAVVTGTDYTALENSMNSELPIVRKGLVTLCNIAGYKYLKEAKNSNGDSLNLITVGVDGREYFNNRPIEVIDDSLVTLTPGKTKLFYTLNMKEAIKFIDKKGIRINSIPGILDGTFKIRLVAQNDVLSGNKRTIKKFELD